MIIDEGGGFKEIARQSFLLVVPVHLLIDFEFPEFDETSFKVGGSSWESV